MDFTYLYLNLLDKDLCHTNTFFFLGLVKVMDDNILLSFRKLTLQLFNIIN